MVTWGSLVIDGPYEQIELAHHVAPGCASEALHDLEHRREVLAVLAVETT